MTDDDIIQTLPATYEQIAERFGITFVAAEARIARLRKNGHNIRAVGSWPDFTLELVPEVVRLAAPKLRSWQDL